MKCAARLQNPDQSAQSTFDEPSDNADFVGRGRELSELKSALDDAMSGHGRMVTLAGEAGIGKTRMAQELASYAESENIRVLLFRSDFIHTKTPCV